ncbi:MAG: DUF3604 domain-containing protein [Alphaproteobacteria bacterium]|nr:DUF3604 domain-containing protein [Alphaproteobacteria bacterium]
MFRWIVAIVFALVSFGAIFWFGARGGWFGAEHGPGTISGKEVLADVIAARMARRSAAGEDDDQILFGDLHVHTTISVDAYQFSLPILGGSGLHPLADACDFARYCSALDFWASTDHAESITPPRWQMVKDAVRACQKVSGSNDNPDMISFIGFEWTQVGRVPQEHFGHKNVIFRDLDDDKVAARAIETQKLGLASPISPLVVTQDFAHRQDYFDYNNFMAATNAVADCDAGIPSDKLPKDCVEAARTPGDLVRKLFDEQRLSPLIIPHGTTWGFYTPAGTTWAKALNSKERPDKFPLIEVYSGHGNSEEYRAWEEVSTASDGKQTCPDATADHLPGCQRAGQIIMERCQKAKIATSECEKRAAQARQNYVDMQAFGHLAAPGAVSADWLDAGQCTDCFLPSFNYRPKTSVQAGLAMSRFDDADGKATRFDWGFIGSSDNHRARPGTGYKQYDRRNNTEATGAPNEDLRKLLIGSIGDANDENPNTQSIALDDIQKLPGLRTVEAERQASFLLTGGLAAVHAKGRSRAQIWDALQRRETYATSGQKTLLWFQAVDNAGAKTPMGSRVAANAAPTFEVRAIGAFKQKPGCPDFAKAGLEESRLAKLCGGECDNPSDERAKITRIEVVKIRPQAKAGEDIASLIQDRFVVHQCEARTDGSCSFTFSDPSYAADKRDALYYVKAIQEAEPMINADPLKCERDASGKCVKVNLCYGDYRSGPSDCTAPAEPRAWSSPIYVDYAESR